MLLFFYCRIAPKQLQLKVKLTSLRPPFAVPCAAFRSLDSAALLFVPLPRFDSETIRHDIHCKCTTQTSIISVKSPCLVLSLLCFVLPACLYNHMPIPATSNVAPSTLRAASSALHVPVQPTPWSTRASHAMHSLHMVDILSQNIPVNHNCFPPSAFVSLRIGISLPLLSALSVLLGLDISGTFSKIWILPIMTPYTHLFFYHMSKFYPIPWQPCLFLSLIDVTSSRCSEPSLPCFYPPWLYPHILFPFHTLAAWLLSVDGPSAVPPNGPRAARYLSDMRFHTPYSTCLLACPFISSRLVPSHSPRTQTCLYTPLAGHEQYTGAHILRIHPHRFTARL